MGLLRTLPLCFHPLSQQISEGGSGWSEDTAPRLRDRRHDGVGPSPRGAGDNSPGLSQAAPSPVALSPAAQREEQSQMQSLNKYFESCTDCAPRFHCALPNIAGRADVRMLGCSPTMFQSEEEQMAFPAIFYLGITPQQGGGSWRTRLCGRGRLAGGNGGLWPVTQSWPRMRWESVGLRPGGPLDRQVSGRTRRERLGRKAAPRRRPGSDIRALGLTADTSR